MRVKTNNFEETQKIGEEFAKNIKNGGVVCLYGDLGAGKTTFVQGVAKGLGIKRRINSPTFITVRKYDNFWHVDLYRLGEIETIGLTEIVNDPENIVLIEWPEKAEKILPKKRWDIYFKQINDYEREIVY